MAKLLVPSQYTTISAAISAATSGDEIIVRGGHYTETLSFSGIDNLVVRGEVGETVEVSNTSTLITLGSTCHHITLENMTFELTGSGSSVLVESAGSGARACKFIDCTFSWRYMNAGSTLQAAISLYTGDSNSPTLVRRCKFLGHSGRKFRRVLDILPASGAGQNVLIESSIFRDISMLALSSVPIRLFCGASSGARYVVRNLTFIDVEVIRNLILMDGGTGASAAKCILYNNVTERLSCTTPANTTAIYSLSGSDIWCGYNSAHNISGITTNVFSPDSEANDFNSPNLLDATGHLTVSFEDGSQSPAYRAGIAQSPSGGERRVMLGLERIPFATVPSRGANEAFTSSRTLLHLKHRNIKPLSGLTFNVTGQAAPTITNEFQSFDSPMEVAQYIEQNIRVTKGLEYGPVECWYDFETHRYRMTMYQGTFSLVCVGSAAKLLGAQNLSLQTDTG